MELAIQKYLRSGKTPEDLTSEYNIKCTRHGKYPNLILFKYWIDTPMNERISQECRGLILDESKNWNIVSFPYLKFWNAHEGLAAEIDWSTAKVMEKLDGSLMTLHYYDNAWQISSSGKPDAAGEVNNSGITFAKLFWDTWEKLGYKLPTNTNICYMFEMITPLNRIVCVYNESRIVLHGARDLQTLCELIPEPIAKEYGWECAKSYPLQTFDEIVDFVKDFNPLANEGVVVVDQEFNRIKIKSPQYLAIAHMKDGFSHKRIIELVQLNAGSEFLSYFPEFTKEYEEVKEKYENLVNEIANVFAKYSPIIAQKDYALAVKHLPYSGILFQLRKNPEKTVKELLRESRLEYVCDLLEH